MKLLNEKKIIVIMGIFLSSFIMVVVIFADSGNFSVPYTFSSGTIISSSQMNANFQAVGQALPATKSLSFSSTTLTGNGTNQNVSGLLAVTPSTNGYLIIFANPTVSTSNGVMACIIPSDSSGEKLSWGSCTEYLQVNPMAQVQYSPGLVTSGNTLYYYLEATDMGTGGSTIQGSISALFIPAPNQLP